jgi:2-haloacid dehalogenase
VELAAAWRTRQFDYACLRTLTGRYLDFGRVTEDALVFSARLLKLTLNDERREQKVLKDAGSG